MMRIAAALLVLPLIAGPALAQKNINNPVGRSDTPPPAADDTGMTDIALEEDPVDRFLLEIGAYCDSLTETPEAMETRAEDEGWTPEVTSTEGTFLESISGYKTFEGVGDASLLAFVETYPNHRMVFCRVDVYGAAEPIDFSTLSGLLPEGLSKTTDTGSYAAWEIAGDRGEGFLHVASDDLGFYFQLTGILNN